MTIEEFLGSGVFTQGTRVKLWSIAGDSVREVDDTLDHLAVSSGRSKLFTYNYRGITQRPDGSHVHDQRVDTEHRLVDLFLSRKEACQALIQRKREQLKEVERLYGEG